MLIVHDILEITGAQGHDEVPQADQGAVRLCEEAEDHVVVVDHGGHLLSGVEALVHVPRPAPVEHAHAVIVVTDQLGLLESWALLVNNKTRCFKAPS